LLIESAGENRPHRGQGEELEGQFRTDSNVITINLMIETGSPEIRTLEQFEKRKKD